LAGAMVQSSAAALAVRLKAANIPPASTALAAVAAATSFHLRISNTLH
jgi:hypothetical protein